MAALPSFAITQDLSDWLGSPITESGDVARAEVALRLASALVRRETGRSWVTQDDPPVLVSPLPDVLSLVTIACAARGYDSPIAAVTSERIDDAQISYRGDETGLYLTASERDLLAPLAGRPHRGLGTVATERGDLGATDCPSWIVNGPHAGHGEGCGC